MKFFRKGGHPYESFDIGVGRKEAKKPLNEHELSYYHAYDKIRWLCKEFVHENLENKEIEIEKFKEFVNKLDSNLPPTNQVVIDLANTILNEDWELKLFWVHLDHDHYRIRDYAEYIKNGVML